MIPSPETALKTAYFQPVTLVVVGALPRSYDCRFPRPVDHARINIEPYNRRAQSQSRFRGLGEGGGVDSQMGGSWGESTRDLREIRGGNEEMEIRLVLTLNPAE